jgi:hypothetical protein
MGVSSSASLFIGFLVTYDDFWSSTTQTSKQPECPEGHPGVAGKFCSDCGGKIEIQKKTVYVPTSKFQAYCDAQNEIADDMWDPEPENQRYLEEVYNHSGFGGLELKCVDGVDGSENEADFVAFGHTVQAVRGICGGGGGKPNELTLEEINQHGAEIGKVRDALGLDRPVKMFLCGYCSY